MADITLDKIISHLFSDCPETESAVARFAKKYVSGDADGKAAMAAAAIGLAEHYRAMGNRRSEEWRESLASLVVEKAVEEICENHA